MRSTTKPHASKVLFIDDGPSEQAIEGDAYHPRSFVHGSS
jgi:hypothetical protein